MKRNLTNLLWPVMAVLLLLLCACGAASAPAASIPLTGDAAGARISLPRGWKEESPNHWQGPDGAYAWVEVRDSQGAGPGAICMGEANRDRPERYGAAPEIREVRQGEQPACLILPSSDQPADRRGEALYLAWLGGKQVKQDLLALHADRQHIEKLAAGVAAGSTSTPVTGACDFSVSSGKAQVSQQGGLRVEEYPVASWVGCRPEGDPSAFEQAAHSGAGGKSSQALQARQYSAERLGRINARLASFGYRVQAYQGMDGTRFRVLHSGVEEKKNLSWLGQVTVRGDGKDFLFPVLDGYNAAAYLVRPDGVHAVEQADPSVFDLVFPIFVGGDEIRLRTDTQTIPRPGQSPALVEVLRSGQVIDTISVSGASPAGGPVRGLWAWEDHWVLVLDGLVIQDGVILNDAVGYAEMFGWRLMNERPFTFFRKDGIIQAEYDGQITGMRYNEVLYQPQMGANILLQMRAYESGLTFFARRGDTWYYVVAMVE